MEYLSRELKELHKNGDFNYHPKCRKLNNIHVCFADDLLMYCRADMESIRILNDAFYRFSQASGLQANASKSAIYMAGIDQKAREEILQTLGFNEGKLPFRYLGIPLDSKKLTIAQYIPLVEKITTKVTCWSAKFLFYVGRCQLIKAVIFGKQTYWAQVFIIPKKVLKLIETICRTSLWTGNAAISKKALVAWENVCKPVAAGGLNILDIKVWNKAAITKHLWDLTRKKDCLWIRWVHSFYIKKRDLDTMPTPKAAAWVIRKIIDSREVIMGQQQL
ncbi:PREDICTED: uncharacterized protein LOC109213816 [Nicotiana attenuata]|uniref:uncharacterized protein LOC109213816 n=1 Tax=Nicotiana attenuata TaxID=49451 RepID=UPI000904E627|nr:PREDICTED: uncharacterized protein LOC109213816 [Nicotiana attenuata]